jgi:hypothetical protein
LLTVDESTRYFLLAFWRQQGGILQFFLPSGDYLKEMYFLAAPDGPGATARRIMKARFDIEHRGNIRIFAQPDNRFGDYVVVVGPTTVEIDKLGTSGSWEHPSWIDDPYIATVLTDVAQRL